MIGIRSVYRRRSRAIASAVAFAVTVILMPALTLAGSWPDRIVRITTPSAPGSDFVARLFAERLAERWRQPVVIDNRPGADGILAVQAFLHANDDHNLLFSFPGVVTVMPLLHESLPFDPVGDLVPISSAYYGVLTIAVTATLPVSSLYDLVAFAKARPGGLNWAAESGAPYLTFLEFQRHAGVAMTFVSYRAAVLALPDLMAGQIQLTVVPLGAALPLAREGRIKLLAVTTPERAVAASDLPTAIEEGFPELTVEAPLGFFGTKTMPMELRERISADVRLLASHPGIKQRLSTSEWSRVAVHQPNMPRRSLSRAPSGPLLRECTACVHSRDMLQSETRLIERLNVLRTGRGERAAAQTIAATSCSHWGALNPSCRPAK